MLARAASAQDRCMERASSITDAPAASFGRERNNVRYSTWGVYLKGEGKGLKSTLRRLQDAASCHKAKVPGRKQQSLRFEKVSRNKVQISWPRPVCADACARVLKIALGHNWRVCVTDPAGVLGADCERVATAEEEVPPTTVDASCSGTLASRSATVEEPKPEAATLPTRRRHHLLSLKIEGIAVLYMSNGSQREDLQQVYTVDWTKELGKGSYGKVYIGATDTAHKDIADEDTAGKVCTSVAIKIMKGKKSKDAVWAAQEEVTRHVALGLHPNIVELIDVGLFSGPDSQGPDHIGLVFDMYEIDVRQFRKTSRFTPGGMRHVLNSVLEGLRFIHDRGLIHCDLKPANIFMRGAMHLRGCFSAERYKQQQLQEFQGMMEFQYQIPNSFEVRAIRQGFSMIFQILVTSGDPRCIIIIAAI